MEGVQARTRLPGVSTKSLGGKSELAGVLLLFVVFIGGWEAITVLLKVPNYIVPPPSQIVLALSRGLVPPVKVPVDLSQPMEVPWALIQWVAAAAQARDGYWLHAGYTLAEALQGFVFGSLLGIVLGTIVSQSRLLEKLFMPYIVAFQSLPKVAIAPLFVIWFGFGMTSKVVICALLTFFPLLINSIAGFKSVDEERVELMTSLSASQWQIFRMVSFPSALPYIFAGLDMAIVYSVIGAIVGEFVGAQRGLGVLILQMNFAMDMAGAFSVFVVLSVMGIGLSGLLNSVRARVLFWAPSERKQRTIGA